jgi:hypothetical protein
MRPVWGAKTSPVFSIHVLDNAPFMAAVCLRLASSRITHPYSNFLFHGHWGTPRKPPVVSVKVANVVLYAQCEVALVETVIAIDQAF